MDRFNAVLVTDDSVNPTACETKRQGNPTTFPFPDSPKGKKSVSISVSNALAGNSGISNPHTASTTPKSLLSNGLLANHVGTPNSNQAKFDQMMEAQMISDILRANTSLRQFKAFRVANEKLYKDKNLADLRTKEIKEPLEAALVENEILTGKLARREELIAILRKQIYNEIIHGTQPKANMTGTDESRLQHLHDIHTSEELKTEELLDKIETFKPVLLSQQQQITKLKQLVASQAEKIRHLFDEIEKMEIFQKDQRRIFDADKETFSTMLEARENKIEMLLEERMDLQEALRGAEKELTDRRSEAKAFIEEKSKYAEKIRLLEETCSSLDHSLDAKTKEYNMTFDELTSLQEAHGDLQGRYNGLVLELDRMVEEGYYIPTDELPVVSSGKKTSKKTHKSSHRYNKGASSSNKLSTVGSVVSGKSKKSKMSSSGSRAGGLSVMSASTMSSQEEDDMLDDDDMDMENDGADLEGGNSNRTSRKQSMAGHRFAQRKAQEDALIAERLQTSAALRQKEMLLVQVSALETKLAEQKKLFLEEKKQLELTQEGLTLGQRVLTTDISKLTHKLATLEKENLELKDEMQVFKTTNTILQTQLNSLPITMTSAAAGPGGSPQRKGMSLFQRISMMLMAPPEESDQHLENAVESFVDKVTPRIQNDHMDHRRQKRKQFFDEIKGVMHLQRPATNLELDKLEEEEANMPDKVYTTEEWEARTRRWQRWQLRRRARRRQLFDQEQLQKKEEAFWQGTEFIPNTDYTSENEEEDDADNYDSENDASGYNSAEEEAKQKTELEENEKRKHLSVASGHSLNEDSDPTHRVDLLHYMFAWENVHQNSITTQCGPGYDPEEVENTRTLAIQFDRDDFYEYLEVNGLLEEEGDEHDDEEDNNQDEKDSYYGYNEDEEAEAEADETTHENITTANNDTNTNHLVKEEDRASSSGQYSQSSIPHVDSGMLSSPHSPNPPMSRKNSNLKSTMEPKSPKTSLLKKSGSLKINRRDTGRPAISSIDNDIIAGANITTFSDSIANSPVSSSKSPVKHTLISNPQAEQEAYMKFKQIYGQQVADLYQGLITIIGQVLPKQKLSILNLDFAQSDKWQSQLVSQDLLVGLDIEWQVKHALLLIHACNEVRNQFVAGFMQEIEAQEKAKHAREARLLAEQEKMRKENEKLKKQLRAAMQSASLDNDENDAADNATATNFNPLPLLRPYIQKSKEEKLLNNPYFAEDYQANCKITLVIRCIDVILQSLHHLLSPIYHLQHSEYPELQRLFPLNAQSRKPFHALLPTYPVDHAHGQRRAVSPPGPRHGSPKRLSNLNNIYANNDTEDVLISGLNSPIVPPPSHPLSATTDFNTFRLTETQLTADVLRGAPKGILQQDNYTSLQRDKVSNTNYLHRSAPRQFPKHIDQILDLLERHSRAASPVPGSGGVRRVRPTSSSSATGAGHNNNNCHSIGLDGNNAATNDDNTNNIGDSNNANAIGEAGMQEQILEEYRNQLTSITNTAEPASSSSTNNSGKSRTLNSKNKSVENTADASAISVRTGLNVLEENSVDSIRSVNHIENIVPRAVSFLNEHSQLSQNANTNNANVSSLKPDDSVSLAQLTLAEDDVSFTHVSNKSSQTKHKDGHFYHLMNRPTSSSPSSSHKKAFGSHTQPLPIQNPILGTHTIRPFSSSQHGPPNHVQIQPYQKEDGTVMEYLDYTRYVFQPSHPAVSAYSHIYSNQQRARTASYHYLQQQQQLQNPQPRGNSAHLALPSSTNHTNTSKKKHANAPIAGVEDADEFLRSTVSPHPLSHPVPTEWNIAMADTVNNNNNNASNNTVSPGVLQPTHASNSVSTSTTSHNVSSNSRGNKAPPSVLTAGRRLRSASPPPARATPTTSGTSSAGIAAGVGYSATSSLSLASSSLITDQLIKPVHLFPTLPVSSTNNNTNNTNNSAVNNANNNNNHHPIVASRPVTSSGFSPRPPSTSRKHISSTNNSNNNTSSTTNTQKRPVTVSSGSRHPPAEDVSGLQTAITGSRLLTTGSVTPTTFKPPHHNHSLNNNSTHNSAHHRIVAMAGTTSKQPAKDAEFYAVRVERAQLPPPNSTQDNHPSIMDTSPLEDQGLTVDILHDVRFFPPPSQPLPPAYHSPHALSVDNYPLLDVKWTGGVTGTRQTLNSNTNDNSNNQKETDDSLFTLQKNNNNSNHQEDMLGGDLQSLLWVSKHKHSSHLKEKVTNTTMFM